MIFFHLGQPEAQSLFETVPPRAIDALKKRIHDDLGGISLQMPGDVMTGFTAGLEGGIHSNGCHRCNFLKEMKFSKSLN